MARNDRQTIEDVHLVDQCLRGDLAAERELFQREYGRVNALVYRVIGSVPDGEDLIQDVFIQVFRSLKNYRGEGRLSSWIDRVAVNVARQYLRSKKPASVQLALVPERADDRRADDQASAREGVRRLYAALAQMAPKARLALALHVIEGRPVAEVADLVGSSVTATKVRIWRARKQLSRLAASDAVLSAYLERETSK